MPPIARQAFPVRERGRCSEREVEDVLHEFEVLSSDDGWEEMAGKEESLDHIRHAHSAHEAH